MPRNVQTSEPQEQIQARIPTSLAAEVRARLQDPIRRRTRYGAMSELIEQLLRQWLKEQQNDSAA